MCRVLEVSRSGYYAWRNRPESLRAQEDRRLLRQIRSHYFGSNGIYGAPRIHYLLAEDGIHVGRKRVARLMRRNGLRAKARRRVKPKGHVADTYLVGLNRPDPAAVKRPDAVWTADVTYIPCGRGFAFLAVVMDLYSRQILGWHLSARRGSQLTIAALKAAIERRRPDAGGVFHSDQGIEYANYPLQRLLELHGFTQSMSRRGNCYDNAHMESFFHSLKTECLHHRRYDNLEMLQRDLFQYIEMFYNRKRPHSALGYLSPAAYQEQHESER